MHVSRKADYAVRALAYLAGRPDDGLVLISEIAAAMAVPQAFLSKIMRELVDADLADSQPGRRGGYKLARDATSITFRQIMEAVDGPIHMVPCQDDGRDSCQVAGNCTQVPIWDRIQLRMLDVFDEYTLDQVRSPHALVDQDVVQVGSSG